MLIKGSIAEPLDLLTFFVECIATICALKIRNLLQSDIKTILRSHIAIKYMH